MAINPPTNTGDLLNGDHTQVRAGEATKAKRGIKGCGIHVSIDCESESESELAELLHLPIRDFTPPRNSHSRDIVTYRGVPNLPFPPYHAAMRVHEYSTPKSRHRNPPPPLNKRQAIHFPPIFLPLFPPIPRKKKPYIKRGGGGRRGREV